ncbi:uncharacterized protein PAC_12795 [Phialocephala subalpina]|uniref:Uncharacterized protein n=1 Tax=Phialocephala subalpina TaxID=576137 RepID=A0A1L7XD10_9HELO|nr:uncharacterized protein PAC_12795 [Phialocephala subalpina]
MDLRQHHRPALRNAGFQDERLNSGRNTDERTAPANFDGDIDGDIQAGFKSLPSVEKPTRFVSPTRPDPVAAAAAKPGHERSRRKDDLVKQMPAMEEAWVIYEKEETISRLPVNMNTRETDELARSTG